MNGVYRYYLKRSATSATLKTVISNSVSKVAPVVSNYTAHQVKLGTRTLTLTKSDLQHIYL